jgi:hypothetical protein
VSHASPFLTEKKKYGEIMNTLRAIGNIIRLTNFNLEVVSSESNRIQALGAPLEGFIKDAYSNSFNLEQEEKKEKYDNVFSWPGAKNSIPDMILKNSDAIEVKKIKGFKSAIHLNSSYPKMKLYRNDPKITEGCRTCEPDGWQEKDIVYVIGVKPDGKPISSLWFVYGDCYAAPSHVYQDVFDAVSDAITNTDLNIHQTKELGQIQKVDPLGITIFCARSMWMIKNPYDVFEEFVPLNKEHTFQLHAIMSKEKYGSFPADDRNMLESFDGIDIKDIDISSPASDSETIKAILIEHVI